MTTTEEKRKHRIEHDRAHCTVETAEQKNTDRVSLSLTPRLRGLVHTVCACAKYSNPLSLVPRPQPPREEGSGYNTTSCPTQWHCRLACEMTNHGTVISFTVRSHVALIINIPYNIAYTMVFGYAPLGSDGSPQGWGLGMRLQPASYTSLSTVCGRLSIVKRTCTVRIIMYGKYTVFTNL